MKKTNKNASLGMALGLCFGAAIGTAVFKNIALGISVGMMLGLVLGAAKDNEVNRQLEQQGYTVQEITADSQNKEYSITIVSKTGVKTTVVVPKSVMDEEAFEVGDAVFLTQDGSLEQAYDKDE